MFLYYIAENDEYHVVILFQQKGSIIDACYGTNYAFPWQIQLIILLCIQDDHHIVVSHLVNPVGVLLTEFF